MKPVPQQHQITRSLIESRESQHVSQRELAKKVGTTQAVISRIENQEVNPSVSLLERISNALGQTLQLSSSPTLEKVTHKLVGEYQTLNNITISSKALLHNHSYFQSQNPQAQIAPVLKSNAYGHGLIEVGEWVDKNLNVPFISVDSLFEAYQLRDAKIHTPILVMGYTNPENFKVFTSFENLHLTVFDEDTLAAIVKYQPQAKIHLKIDTGMHRLGLLPSQTSAFLKILKKYPKANIVGIYSHLASADTDPEYSQKQVDIFKEVIQLFKSHDNDFEYTHLAATAGSFYIKDPIFNVIRLGLGFYGYSLDSTQKSQLKPAFTLTTTIAQIKKVGEGNAISYNGTFVTKKPTTIAILPIGYHDGVNRQLSNIGTVYIKNTPCPIIGNITMNQTIIDISKVKQVGVGDTVEIISPKLKQNNTVYSHAQNINTIPYTILTSLNQTIKRKIV